MRWVVCAVAISGLMNCSEESPEEPIALITREQVLLETSRTFAVAADARVEGTYPTQSLGARARSGPMGFRDTSHSCASR